MGPYYFKYPDGVQYSESLTPESCGQFCVGLGFKYSGVESGNQCFCGTDLHPSTTSTNCTTPCAGHVSQTCGGTYAIQVYGLTSGSSDSNAGKIIGPVIGGIAALAAIAFALYCFYRRHQRTRRYSRTEIDLLEVEDGSLSATSPSAMPHPFPIDEPEQHQSNPPKPQHTAKTLGLPDNSHRPSSSSSTSRIDPIIQMNADTAEGRLTALPTQVTGELGQLRVKRTFGENTVHEAGDAPPPYVPA
jgi:hypothetical protein